MTVDWTSKGLHTVQGQRIEVLKTGYTGNSSEFNVGSPRVVALVTDDKGNEYVTVYNNDGVPMDRAKGFAVAASSMHYEVSIRRPNENTRAVYFRDTKPAAMDAADEYTEQGFVVSVHKVIREFISR